MFILKIHLHGGRVHIKRISTIGINARGYFSSDSMQRRSIDMWRSMMELDKRENM
jgi:hypothetical protein